MQFEAIAAVKAPASLMYNIASRNDFYRRDCNFNHYYTKMETSTTLSEYFLKMAHYVSSGYICVYTVNTADILNKHHYLDRGCETTF